MPKDILNVKNTGICSAADFILLICSSLYPVVARTIGVPVERQYSKSPSSEAGFE